MVTVVRTAAAMANQLFIRTMHRKSITPIVLVTKAGKENLDMHYICKTTCILKIQGM